MDHPLSAMWAAARTLRIVDGPDEVHLRTLMKGEVRHQGKGSPGRKDKEGSIPAIGKPRL